jgi:hypothetical protein
MSRSRTEGNPAGVPAIDERPIIIANSTEHLLTVTRERDPLTGPLNVAR